MDVSTLSERSSSLNLQTQTTSLSIRSFSETVRMGHKSQNNAFTSDLHEARKEQSQAIYITVS